MIVCLDGSSRAGGVFLVKARMATTAGLMDEEKCPMHARSIRPQRHAAVRPEPKWRVAPRYR